MLMPARRVPLADRLWAKVDKGGPIPAHLPELGPCWVWTGARQRRVDGSAGYGLIRTTSRAGDPKTYVHRVSFFLDRGRWPADAVLHKCDNRLCVRPDHLFEGTLAENVWDAQAKGRTALGDRNAMRRPAVRAKIEGERNPAAKLTDAQATEVAAQRRDGVPIKQVAAAFGISKAQVSNIANGKSRALAVGLSRCPVCGRLGSPGELAGVAGPVPYVRHPVGAVAAWCWPTVQTIER
jgi:HNH endonuclease